MQYLVVGDHVRPGGVGYGGSRVGVITENRQLQGSPSVPARQRCPRPEGRWATHSATPGSAAPHRWRALLLAGFGYLILSVFIWSNVWTSHPTSTTTCGCGDTSLFTWFIAWPAYAISHGLDPIYSTAMHYPVGVNLLANTSVLAIGVLTGPDHLGLRPDRQLERGVDPRPGPLVTGHVRAPPPLGHVDAGRLHRWPVLRLLPVHPGRPHRCPSDARAGGGPASVHRLSGRVTDPATPTTGCGRGRPRAARDAAVLHRHRGPRHHGDRGCHRRRPPRRLRRLAPPRHPPEPSQARLGRPGRRCDHRSGAPGHPDMDRAGRTRTLLRRFDLALRQVRRPAEQTHLAQVLRPTVADLVHTPAAPSRPLVRRWEPGARPVIPVLRFRRARRDDRRCRRLAPRPSSLAVRSDGVGLGRAVPGCRQAAADQGAAGGEHRSLPIRPHHLPGRGRHVGIDRRARVRGRGPRCRPGAGSDQPDRQPAVRRRGGDGGRGPRSPWWWRRSPSSRPLPISRRAFPSPPSRWIFPPGSEPSPRTCRGIRSSSCCRRRSSRPTTP